MTTVDTSKAAMECFADRLRHDYPAVKHCYIALIPAIEDENRYGLEVEVGPYEIGGVFDSGTTDTDRARALADRLERELSVVGFHILWSRGSWERINLNKEGK